jgi:hypothetical protein
MKISVALGARRRGAAGHIVDWRLADRRAGEVQWSISFTSDHLAMVS